VSHHHDVRGLEDPAQFGDGLLLCRSIHCKLFPVMTACPRVAEAAGLLPAVPLLSSRAANRAGRRFNKPAPRGSRNWHRVSEVRTKQARWKARKLGSHPRLCWPLPGLSLGPRTSAPAVLDRSVGPFPNRLCAPQGNGTGFSLSDVPPGCPKGMGTDHHWLREKRVLETRKGAPTNWAGTPDGL
jgi:hypothetical protein